MSSGQLNRSLKVIVGNHQPPNKHYNVADMLQILGHAVVAQFVTKAELVAGLRDLSHIPDLIITNITDRSDLQEVYRIMTRRNAQVPLLITTSEVAKMILCDELDFVFGVCPEPVDQENFQAALCLAIHRFAQHQKLSAQVRLAEEALAGTKATQHACAILFDRHKQTSMATAHRLLQKIAASNQRTVKDQAERIIKADLEMHPKRPKPANHAKRLR